MAMDHETLPAQIIPVPLENRPNTIERFRGKNFFLSNMFDVDSGIDTPVGLVDTTEHAYQLSKFDDESARVYVATAPNGIESKQRAYELKEAGVPVRADWDEAKLGIMLGYNRQKFTRNPELAARLVATGSKRLVEGNTWDDRFWGVSPPRTENGANNLGKILMYIRDDLLLAE